MERLEEIPYAREMLNVPYHVLKDRLVSASPGSEELGGKRLPLDQHLQRLTREFNGKTQLAFLHTVLIVLIRRQIELETARSLFFDLWEKETAFLCKHLTLRWLVSACDTICDYPRSAPEATTAVAASMLINTVKLYETERLTLESLETSQPRLAKLRAKHADLFDGLTTFKVGRGDMIRKLVVRLNRNREADEALVSRIFFAAVERLFHSETVFLRFGHLHTNDLTKW